MKYVTTQAIFSIFKSKCKLSPRDITISIAKKSPPMNQRTIIEKYILSRCVASRDTNGKNVLFQQTNNLYYFSVPWRVIYKNSNILVNELTTDLVTIVICTISAIQYCHRDISSAVFQCIFLYIVAVQGGHFLFYYAVMKKFIIYQVDSYDTRQLEWVGEKRFSSSITIYLCIFTIFFATTIIPRKPKIYSMNTVIVLIKLTNVK